MSQLRCENVRLTISGWEKVVNQCESSCLSFTVDHVQVVVSYVTNRRIEIGSNSRFTNLNNIGYVVHCYSFFLLLFFLLMTYIINKQQSTKPHS